MYIDADTIIKAAAVLAAVTAVGAAAYKALKWFQTQEKQTLDIKDLKEEQCLMSYAMLACLDGLKQLHCNGAVTEAHSRLEKHLNKRAHDQS